MNILHLIFSFQMGGAEVMLRDIVAHQLPGNRVTLIVVNNQIDPELLSQIDSQVRIIKVNRTPGSKNIVDICRINLAILQISPDIIHCHDHLLVNLLFPPFRKRTILTLHTTGIVSSVLSKYAMLVAISKAVQMDIDTRYRIKSHLIYNGIEVDSLRKRIADCSSSASSAIRIIQVSRLDHTLKGHDLLIRAFAKSRRSKDGSHLTFIGEGASRHYLESLVNELNLTHVVTFLGKQSRKRVYSTLCNYDLLVQPSRIEGFGLTIAEAMAARVPVIISNLEGPMEVIDNGKYGYFFESNAVDSLAACLERVTCDEDKVNQAEKWVYANFDIRQTVANYKSIYQQLLKKLG